MYRSLIIHCVYCLHLLLLYVGQITYNVSLIYWTYFKSILVHFTPYCVSAYKSLSIAPIPLFWIKTISTRVFFCFIFWKVQLGGRNFKLFLESFLKWNILAVTGILPHTEKTNNLKSARKYSLEILADTNGNGLPINNDMQPVMTSM